MVLRQCSKHPLTLCGKEQHDTAPIGGVVRATNQTCFLATFAEFDDAIVSEAQSLRCIGYRRFDIVRSACDVQQELMLLRLQTGFYGASFAEVEELAERITKLRKALDLLSIFRMIRFRHE
jgi:hypothetical protein